MVLQVGSGRLLCLGCGRGEKMGHRLRNCKFLIEHDRQVRSCFFDVVPMFVHQAAYLIH